MIRPSKKILTAGLRANSNPPGATILAVEGSSGNRPRGALNAGMTEKHQRQSAPGATRMRGAARDQSTEQTDRLLHARLSSTGGRALSGDNLGYEQALTELYNNLIQVFMVDGFISSSSVTKSSSNDQSCARPGLLANASISVSCSNPVGVGGVSLR